MYALSHIKYLNFFIWWEKIRTYVLISASLFLFYSHQFPNLYQKYYSIDTPYNYISASRTVLVSIIVLLQCSQITWYSVPKSVRKNIHFVIRIQVRTESAEVFRLIYPCKWTGQVERKKSTFIKTKMCAEILTKYAFNEN